MTYAEMVTEAMGRSKPVQNDTHGKLGALGAAAIIARDQMRQLDYMLQAVREDDGSVPHEADYRRVSMLAR